VVCYNGLNRHFEALDPNSFSQFVRKNSIWMWLRVIFCTWVGINIIKNRKEYKSIKWRASAEETLTWWAQSQLHVMII
jgi:hypothetical protein